MSAIPGVLFLNHEKAQKKATKRDKPRPREATNEGHEKGQTKATKMHKRHKRLRQEWLLFFVSCAFCASCASLWLSGSCASLWLSCRGPCASLWLSGSCASLWLSGPCGSLWLLFAPGEGDCRRVLQGQHSFRVIALEVSRNLNRYRVTIHLYGCGRAKRIIVYLNCPEVGFT